MAIRVDPPRTSRAGDLGPYLIISRACGLALDTGNQSEPGNWTILWSPHAERQQLWYLRPTGVIGEFAVVSADNGLALDATRETIGDIHPVMSEVKDEVWQRWRLEDAPDGAAYLLQSAHSRRFMTVNHDAGQTWSRSQLRGGLTCVVAGAWWGRVRGRGVLLVSGVLF